MGQLDEAIADFTAVLELEPDHVKAAYARGACRNLKGEFAPAIGEPDSIRYWRPGSASLSEGVVDWQPCLTHATYNKGRSAICCGVVACLVVLSP